MMKAGAVNRPDFRGPALDGAASLASGFHVTQASTVATIPMTNHTAEAPQTYSPAARPMRPARTIPTPTPEKTTPVHFALPIFAGIETAQAETPIKTKALAAPPENRKTSQC